tara:strand:+ start:56098 stop:57105 length:1008 start_codon:yes stop_codon:yes gene_type:complete
MGHPAVLAQTRTDVRQNASDWKRSGAHRLRVGTAIAIFAMAACADDAASDRNARVSEPAGPAVAMPEVVPAIAIAALSGVPAAEAEMFAALLREEAARARLPLAGDGSGRYELSGALGAGGNANGTYVVTVIDMHDAQGERVHRVVNEENLPRRAGSNDPWADIDSNDLRRIAAGAAAQLAAWHRNEAGGGVQAAVDTDSGIVTGSIAGNMAELQPDRRPFEIIVGAAPGDGNAALTQALDGALARRMPTATWLRNEGYRIEGSVVTASRRDGRTEVSIRWVVTSPEGKRLGEVKQRNAIEAARVAGSWGKLAETAAEAAADGVLALLAAPAGKS